MRLKHQQKSWSGSCWQMGQAASSGACPWTTRKTLDVKDPGWSKRDAHSSEEAPEQNILSQTDQISRLAVSIEIQSERRRLNFVVATFLISKRVETNVSTFYLTQYNQQVTISTYNQYMNVSKSLKSGVHFIFLEHLHLDHPHCKCSMAMCGWWLWYWWEIHRGAGKSQETQGAKNILHDTVRQWGQRLHVEFTGRRPDSKRF